MLTTHTHIVVVKRNVIQLLPDFLNNMSTDTSPIHCIEPEYPDDRAETVVNEAFELLNSSGGPFPCVALI